MRRLLVSALALGLFATFDLAAQPATRSADIRRDVLQETESGQPWTNVATGFNGARFGMSVSEASSIVGPLSCSEQKLGASPPYSRCEPTEKGRRYRIGENGVGTAYLFEADRLIAVLLSADFGSGLALASKIPSFDAARAAFVVEFGEPTAEREYRDHGSRSETKYASNEYGFKSPKTKSTWVDTATRCASWSHAEAGAEVCGENGKFSSASVHTPRWKAIQAAAFPKLKLKK